MMGAITWSRRSTAVAALVAVLAIVGVLLYLTGRSSTKPVCHQKPDPAYPGECIVAAPASPTATHRPGSACVPDPAGCGFPSAATTGPPAGTRLTPSGSLTISQAGRVVSGLEVTGCVTITAPRVVFRDSVVHGTGCRAVVYVRAKGAGAMLDHVEIDGAKSNGSDGSPDPGLYGFGFTATALDVHDTGDAVDVESHDTLTESYLHDLRVAAGSHTDGVQATGADQITLRHNTILANCASCNAGVIFGADQGDITGVVVADNLIDGRNVVVNAGNGSAATHAQVSFDGNRFGRSFQQGLCNTNDLGGLNRLSYQGNVYDDTGAPASC